jgi:hypothetical protein
MQKKVKIENFPSAIFSKNYKGLSTIVVTLIIIVLALVAVGVVWLVVSNVLKSNSSQIGTSGLTLSMDIEHVYQNNDSVNVGVVRNVGEGTVTKIQFIFSDGVDSTAVTREVNLSELQTRSFVFQLAEINLSSIKSISIVPYYIGNNGNELLGNVKDTYSLTTNTSMNLNTNCFPTTCTALGYECGIHPNGNCSGTLSCGTCSPGYTCTTNGSCMYCGNFNTSTYSCISNSSNNISIRNNCGENTSVYCNMTQTCVANSTRCIYASCANPSYTTYSCSGNVSVSRSGCGVYQNITCNYSQICLANVTRCMSACVNLGYTCGTYHGTSCGTCNSGYTCSSSTGGTCQAVSTGSAIIINHLNTNISKIPSSYIQLAKQNFRISYGHSSHGSQVVTGMGMLSSENSLYNYTTGGATSVYFLSDTTPSGDLGNPDRTSWATRTRTMLNASGNTRNVVIWSWCGQVDGTQTDIQNYLDLLNQLEQDYPTVKFVYMTGHLNGGGPSGNVYARNNQIRNYCIAYNKTLFDFADIESYDPSGTYYPTESDACGWCTTWCSSHTCPSCGTCAHSNCFNCYQKGKAFWWMMARLAGWNGVSS